MTIAARDVAPNRKGLPIDLAGPSRFGTLRVGVSKRAAIPLPEDSLPASCGCVRNGWKADVSRRSVFQKLPVLQDDLATLSPERQEEDARFGNCAPFSIFVSFRNGQLRRTSSGTSLTRAAPE